MLIINNKQYQKITKKEKEKREKKRRKRMGGEVLKSLFDKNKRTFI